MTWQAKNVLSWREGEASRWWKGRRRGQAMHLLSVSQDFWCCCNVVRHPGVERACGLFPPQSFWWNFSRLEELCVLEGLCFGVCKWQHQAKGDTMAFPYLEAVVGMSSLFHGSCMCFVGFLDISWVQQTYLSLSLICLLRCLRFTPVHG